MTNAIKFTAAGDNRVITVTVGASLEPPLKVTRTKDFQYIPRRIPNNSINLGEDWGSGEIVYLFPIALINLQGFKLYPVDFFVVRSQLFLCLC